MSNDLEDQIATFVSFTGFGLDDDDRNLVIKALERNGNSAEKVVDEYYNDIESFKNKYNHSWTESMFDGERDGPQQGPQSFHVEAPYQGSEVIQGVDPSQMTAPSRPPSRTNGQGLDRVADWATETAGVPDAWDQQGVSNEDRDLEEALRLSRETAQAQGIEMPEQESGVINMDTSVTAPSFGPATREFYDDKQWAMTLPVNAFQGTYRSEVAPSKRERKMGAPAFLVDASDRAQKSRLGAYLTILHEIPLARNLYLKDAPEDFNYGNDPQWWKGELISRPHVLGDDDQGELEWENMDPAAEVRDELRRLMGFLDSTTRSYATIEGVVKLRPSFVEEAEFYNDFAEYFQNEETANPFFSKLVIERCFTNGSKGASAEQHKDHSRNVDDSSSGSSESPERAVSEPVSETVSEPDVRIIHAFELHLGKGNEGATNLYSLLDTFMWSNFLERGEMPIPECKMAMLHGDADIFAINIAEGLKTAIDVPEVFYCERWLPSRKEESLKMMVELYKLKKREEAAMLEKLRLYTDPKIGNKREFLPFVEARFEHCAAYLDGKARFRTVEESGFDLDKYPDYHMAEPEFTEQEKVLYAKLKEASAAAHEKHEAAKRRSQEITDELQRIQGKRNALSRLLTDPDKKSRPKPMSCKKHLLQGVATKNNIVYVCKRAREDLIELSDVPKERDQWWRLELNAQDTEEPVKTDILDFAIVKTRMWEETKSPLLVYASEEAARAEPTALPAALQRFVKADNKAFRQELNQEQEATAEEAPAGEMWDVDMQAQSVPFSPSKRKHRDSVDSMNSNRPSIGSVEGNASEDPFRDGDASSPTRAQKRQSPGASQSSNVAMESVETAPPLPRRPGSTEQTSRIQTPKTAGDGTTPDTQQTTPLPTTEGNRDDVQVVKSDLETKAPEMQQRPQASIFINRDSKTETVKPNDMDIDG